jgi:hypothetical protein
MFILSLRPPFPEFRTMCDANDHLDRNTREHWNVPIEGNTTQVVLETDETEKDGDDQAAGLTPVPQNYRLLDPREGLSGSMRRRRRWEKGRGRMTRRRNELLLGF